jgi:hypothetical protein
LGKNFVLRLGVKGVEPNSPRVSGYDATVTNDGLRLCYVMCVLPELLARIPNPGDYWDPRSDVRSSRRREIFFLHFVRKTAEAMASLEALGRAFAHRYTHSMPSSVAANDIIMNDLDWDALSAPKGKRKEEQEVVEPSSVRGAPLRGSPQAATVHRNRHGSVDISFAAAEAKETSMSPALRHLPTVRSPYDSADDAWTTGNSDISIGPTDWDPSEWTLRSRLPSSAAAPIPSPDTARTAALSDENQRLAAEKRTAEEVVILEQRAAAVAAAEARTALSSATRRQDMAERRAEKSARQVHRLGAQLKSAVRTKDSAAVKHQRAHERCAQLTTRAASLEEALRGAEAEVDNLRAELRARGESSSLGAERAAVAAAGQRTREATTARELRAALRELTEMHASESAEASSSLHLMAEALVSQRELVTRGEASVWRLEQRMANIEAACAAKISAMKRQLVAAQSAERAAVARATAAEATKRQEIAAMAKKLDAARRAERAAAKDAALEAACNARLAAGARRTAARLAEATRASDRADAAEAAAAAAAAPVSPPRTAPKRAPPRVPSAAAAAASATPPSGPSGGWAGAIKRRNTLLPPPEDDTPPSSRSSSRGSFAPLSPPSSDENTPQRTPMLSRFDSTADLLAPPAESPGSTSGSEEEEEGLPPPPPMLSDESGSESD